MINRLLERITLVYILAVIGSIILVIGFSMLIKTFTEPEWTVELSKYGTCYEFHYGNLVGEVDLENCR
ncbi:hypothetical protein LCGC14_0347290 [marine sediment metagenome]|uniref:Uncharacterized protein n=1 Tax=marine sediment metagenome TaxID=412755 RepID=A0A0F9TUM7_9ZZZZ